MIQPEQPKNAQPKQVSGLQLAPDLNKYYDDPKLYSQEDKMEASAMCLVCCGNISRGLCFPLAPCGCGPLMKINQGEIGLLLHQGKLSAKLGPGLHTYNTCLDELIRVDMKTRILQLPSQLLITRDNVTIYMSAYVFYNVVVPEYAVFRIQDAESLVRHLTMGTIKSVVATKKLSDLLTKRKEIEDYIAHVIDEKTEYFGIDITELDTMSMDLPKDLETALMSSAQAEREAKAKIISAKGNLESARIFKNSAQELSKNKVSLQLQYFDVLKRIAEDKPTHLVLPYFINE